MTDEQIIKAFEEILKNQNNKLSLIERTVCDDVLSLAIRQKAEIERLTAKILVKDNINDYNTAQLRIAREELRTAKSEAIKEFARELKCGVPQETGVIRCKDIDTLVKEMTEESE